MNEYCGIHMTKGEMEYIEIFDKQHIKHSKGKGLLQFIITPGPYSVLKEIRCIECNTKEEIIDLEEYKY